MRDIPFYQSSISEDELNQLKAVLKVVILIEYLLL